MPALGLALFAGHSIPEGLVEACSASDILLILLPDVPFRDLTEVVMTRILGDRQDALLREAPASKELAARLGRGEGVAALTDVLARETGTPCWILFRDGTTAGTHQPVAAERQRIWEQAFSMPPPRGGVSEISALTTGPVTVAPVGFERVDGDAEAVAMLVCQTSLTSLRQRVDGLVRLTEHYLPVATEASRRQRRAMRDAVTGLLERLLDGTVDDDELYAAAWPEPRRNHEAISVLVAGSDGQRSVSADHLEGAVRAVLHDIRPATGRLQELTVTLLPHAPLELTGLAASVWEKLRSVLGSSVLLGVSAGLRSEIDVGQLVLQASNAQRVAGSSADGRGWATSREAGSHALLLATANPDILQSLHLTTLAPLIAYDRLHGAQLLRTLETYLGADGSWQRAAESLCLHVNSLRYRITRIEQLTGRQMSAMEDRVDFFLALRALERSEASGSEQPPTTTTGLRGLAR